MTAIQFFNANVRDGRAWLRPGSHAGRPPTWLVRVQRQLILVTDNSYPALRFVPDTEAIVEWRGIGAVPAEGEDAVEEDGVNPGSGSNAGRVTSHTAACDAGYPASEEADMDVSKIKSAVNAVREAVKSTVNTTLEAGKKDSRQFTGLQELAKIDQLLEKIDVRADAAVKRTAPPVKKEKKEKDAKK